MTARLTKLWDMINKGLTFINILLFGIVIGGMALFDYKKEQYTKVPVAVNILLLLVLSLALFANIYKYL